MRRDEMSDNGVLKVIILSIFVACFFTCSKKTIITHKDTGILERTVTVEGDTYSYHVYLPVNYDSERKWPVMLYLHGSGQTGNIWSISSGLGRALRQHPERFPCIVIFPECPLSKYWIGKMSTYAVKAMDQSVKEFNGDEKKLYVSGVSMGGYGTWICAVNNPGKFAALVPLSGGVVPPFAFSRKVRAMISPQCLAVLDSEDPYKALAQSIGTTPSWIFHGSLDNVIPVSESQKIYAALKENSGNVKYTEYPDRSHDLESTVYFEQDLIAWLLIQRLE
jgi:predicted peptidase